MTHSIFSHFERHLNVTLRAKVIDLGRLDLRDNVHQVGAITKVPVMVDEFSRPCKASKYISSHFVNQS
jgi:hypothetical protein